MAVLGGVLGYQVRRSLVTLGISRLRRCLIRVSIVVSRGCVLGGVILAISAPVHHGLARLSHQIICNIRSILVDSSPLVRHGLSSTTMTAAAALAAIIDVTVLLLLLLCACTVVL